VRGERAALVAGGGGGQIISVAIGGFDREMMVAVPAAAGEPEAESVVFLRVPLDLETVTGLAIMDGGPAFVDGRGENFGAKIGRKGGGDIIHPSLAVEEGARGGGKIQLIAGLQAQERMDGPQEALARVAAVGQLVFHADFILMQLDGAREFKRGKFRPGGGFQNAVAPGGIIDSPGQIPQLAVIGKLPPLPDTGSDGGKTFIDTSERTLEKIITLAIAKEFPALGRMPEPFASGTEIFQGNDFGAEFGHDLQLHGIAGEHADLVALLMAGGEVTGESFHQFRMSCRAGNVFRIRAPNDIEHEARNSRAASALVCDCNHQPV